MKLKICGNGFKDLDNPNIWYSNENSDVIQWLSEGNVPEPEFTEAELAQRELNNSISEAKQYLASTDYKMTMDYYATLTLAESSELTLKRVEAREFIRLSV